jgi:hypothetical protein
MRNPEKVVALWQANCFEDPTASSLNDADPRAFKTMLSGPPVEGNDGRCAFAPREHKGQGVAEFRAHEGTLDPDLILAWARVCEGLVRKALLPPSTRSSCEPLTTGCTQTPTRSKTCCTTCLYPSTTLRS